MTEDASETLGDFLKKGREASQLSLEDLSKATHLSADLLLALENNRLESFSHPDTIVGYLKLCSIHLGLDKAEVLERAEREFAKIRERQKQKGSSIQFRSYNSLLHPARREGGEPFPRPDRMLMKRAALSAFIVLIISLFFLIPSEYRGPAEIRSDVVKAAPDPVVGSVTKSPAAVAPSAVPAPVDLAQPAATPVPVPAVSPSPAPKAAPAVKIIGNEDSRRYHLPGMQYYDKVLPHHRVIFASEEEAIAAGYHKATR